MESDFIVEDACIDVRNNLLMSPFQKQSQAPRRAVSAQVVRPWVAKLVASLRPTRRWCPSAPFCRVGYRFFMIAHASTRATHGSQRQLGNLRIVPGLRTPRASECLWLEGLRHVAFGTPEQLKTLALYQETARLYSNYPISVLTSLHKMSVLIQH